MMLSSLESKGKVKELSVEAVRVLVVCYEDKEIELYKTVFRGLDCEVSGTTNPDHAIKLFQSYFINEKPFHIVCTEWQLAGMNGISLARCLDLIYPEVVLHLLPTMYFYEAAVLEDFVDFGGFVMEPDDSYAGLKSLVGMVRK